MLLDMLSTDMYVNYNIKLAHRIGLHTSIYVTELLNINRKAIHKGKLVEGNFFKVDRNYIEQRTTLTKAEQKELDTILVNLNVMQISSTSKDILNINMDALTGILLDDDAKVESSIKSIAKRKRPTKQDAIKENLKLSITTTNIELREAYFEWIDAVFMRNGWMSKAAVVEAQRIIDTYTGKDLDMALDILRIGATNGYRDIAWAINNYEKDNVHSKVTAQINATSDVQQRAKVLFSDEEY